MRMVTRTVLLASLIAAAAYAPAHVARAADQTSELSWQVENPFRFYRSARPFAMHEAAFKAVRGGAEGPLSPAIIQQIERCLNDPDASGRLTPAACATQARTRGRTSAQRLGWAAYTLDDVCYDRDARPRRYPANCDRRYPFSRNAVREDTILPSEHVVSVQLSRERLAQVGAGSCSWRWQPRKGGDWSENVQQPCSQRFVISRLPYSRDRAASGGRVEVTLPDGQVLSNAEVVVEDLLIVALGDSFSSGEGNPDRPVTFSAGRAMNYRLSFEPIGAAMLDTRGFGRSRTPPPAADGRKYDPYVLPRRLLEDEQAGEQYNPRSEDFRRAFWAREAQWMSPDCHRSQYAYPMRVATQLALEDRTRSITFLHLSCSGAEVTRGLFMPLEAREHFDSSAAKTKMVPAQFDQLTSLLCRTSARVDGATERLALFEPGTTQATMTAIKTSWCPPAQRKRDIDLVLLSIGGNDVGFGALAAYSFLDSAGDIAAIARAKEGKIRFGPDVASVYLEQLDERMEAVKRALDGGFGVKPSRVIQTSYEPLQYDESQQLCGSVSAGATLGMDVHPKFRFSQVRLGQVGDFFDQLLARLACTAKHGAGCPKGLRTGQGTGFRLVTEHQPSFLRRGLCARDPGDDGRAMQMPRIPVGETDFAPTSPDEYRPYASRTRLFRTPNDAFLTANTHSGPPVPLIDIMQPAFASLYSGAFHPTAQAHALVADFVMPHARRVVGQGK